MTGNLLSQSLNGKVLAVTRKGVLAKEFIRLVNLEGGTVISLPTIDVEPAEPKVVEEFIDKISGRKYDYCMFKFTSSQCSV
jgi:uroporphyrinogen-III synthase